MNRLQPYFAAVLLLFPLSCCALTCPNNFQIIKMGDSLASVTQKCGQPDNIQQRNVPPANSEEWTYYIESNFGSAAKFQDQKGKIKTTVMLDKQRMVQNISVNGFGVPSTNICGSQISVGDTEQQVKAACGKAQFTSQAENTQQQTFNVETTYFYNSSPPVTMVFQNDSLSQVK